MHEIEYISPIEYTPPTLPPVTIIFRAKSHGAATEGGT